MFSVFPSDDQYIYLYISSFAKQIFYQGHQYYLLDLHYKILWHLKLGGPDRSGVTSAARWTIGSTVDNG
jgi:hypothetical protein